MKFTDSKAAERFWVFGRNEETNKKIKNHPRNIEMKEIIEVKER